MEKLGFLRRTFFPLMSPSTHHSTTPFRYSVVVLAASDEFTPASSSLMPLLYDNVTQLSLARYARSACEIGRTNRSTAEFSLRPVSATVSNGLSTFPLYEKHGFQHGSMPRCSQTASNTTPMVSEGSDSTSSCLFAVKCLTIIPTDFPSRPQTLFQMWRAVTQTAHLVPSARESNMCLSTE